MSIARRGFLRLLPGAAVAAPIVAKAAADELMGQQAGLVRGVLGGGVEMAQACAPAPPDRSRIKDFFSKFGLPDFERDRIWQETSVHYLDPDIAAKKSWSMNVKILTQRERNFKQRIGRELRAWDFEDAREAFQRKHGFWFWW